MMRRVELASLPERIRTKIAVNADTGCWEWTASTTGAGYGKVWWEGRLQQAHRTTYEILVGPIPDGLVTDHLCENTVCVNPEHLEPVTQWTNVMRGSSRSSQNHLKTHCQYGHEFTERNTKVTSTGVRQCLACNRRREGEANARRVAARALLPPKPPATHCRKGHEYTEDNVYVDSRGARNCRACKKVTQQRADAKRAGTRKEYQRLRMREYRARRKREGGH